LSRTSDRGRDRGAAAAAPGGHAWQGRTGWEWGGRGGRKTTVNFTFITERPTRNEIEREVKSILEELLK
jgi:hypothetical protein